MGGFGGAAAGGSKKKKKKGNDQKAGGLSSTTTNAVSKLKPKSQWDKYKNLKEASTIQVAVRVAATDDSPDAAAAAAAGEWCEIGKVRSEGDAFTELAVVLQRGLIAEVRMDCLFGIFLLLSTGFMVRSRWCLVLLASISHNRHFCVSISIAFL
jgi:hypothetical protein